MRIPLTTEHHLARFYSKVIAGAGGCHVWTGGIRSRKARNQYPNFVVGGDQLGGHVWIYEQMVGPVPAGYVVDHLCGNTLCVNHRHLEAVTNQENVRRGKNTKLSPDLVIEIRERVANGESQRSIAPEYGVSPSTIRHAVSGRSWATL